MAKLAVFHNLCFRLFQVSPDARELFHFIDKVDLLSLIENPQLIWHCNRILEALDDVVCSLDNLPAVAHAMSNLGRRHVTYGAKPDHLHVRRSHDYRIQST